MSQPVTVRVGLFGLTTPFLLARSRGLFADRGIDVEFTRVTSSAEQFRDLADGRLDVVQTAYDNVLNYAANSSNALGAMLDVRALFALDAGMSLTLVGAPQITQIEDLRGRTVSVDDPESGFAYVLYGLLERSGLQRGIDYRAVAHGGVVERFERIRAGDSSGTLLSNGFELVAAAAGLATLATSRDLVYPYLGSVLAATDVWLARNDEIADSFSAAYEAGRVLGRDDPGARAEVTADMVRIRGLDPVIAASMIDAEFGASGLLAPSIDIAAATAVIELRRRFGGFDDPSVSLDYLISQSTRLVRGSA